MKELIKNKNLKYIFIMIIFFSISFGLWNNFRLLWLEENSLDPSEISRVMSLATFFGAISIIFISLKISMTNIKKLLSATLLIRIVSYLILYIGYQHLPTRVIAILFIFDIASYTVGYLAIYPLITRIIKNDKIYSYRKLTTYICQDLGVLLGGILLGFTIGNYIFDYNSFLLIALICLIIAFLSLSKVKLNEKIHYKNISVKDYLKILKKDKIDSLYLFYTLIGNISYNCALGMQMLILNNILDISSKSATFYFLLMGIIADIFGILALKKLTPKNDYLTILLKFGPRMLGYSLVFIIPTKEMTLIAITISLFLTTAYEDKTDAIYLNRIDTKYQLLFSNIRELVGSLGNAIGLYLTGILFVFGSKYIFGVAALIGYFQIALALYLVYLKKRYKKIVLN